MIWAKYFSVIAVFLGYLISGTFSVICNFCLTTSEQNDCNYEMNCSEGVGCFSRTWVHQGIRLYDKGCQSPSIVSCFSFMESFCTPDNAIHCCNTDTCNSVDLVSTWKPLKPRNLIISYPSANTIKLKWDIQCNGVYEYRVTYQKVGENALVIANINTNQIEISNISAGLYDFSVVSLYDSRISDTVTINRQVTVTNITRYLYCTFTNNQTLNAPNSTSIQQCRADEQRCFTILNSYTDGGQVYVTRGCTTSETCQLATEIEVPCRPGVKNNFCSFCCEGKTCNKDNDVMLSNLTCEDITQTTRIDCGWEGINPVTCLSRGCCYKKSDSDVYDKWCYHKRLGEGTLATTPTNDVLIGGLNIWVIIIIVFAILLLLIIIGIIIYCARAKRRERKKGFYNVDPIYATPSSFSQRVRTISRTGIENSRVSIESTT